MDYRTILVELTTERSVAINVPVAIRLADQFDAACIGLHVMAEPDPASRTPPPRRARPATSSRQPFNARRAATQGSSGPRPRVVPSNFSSNGLLRWILQSLRNISPKGSTHRTSPIN